MPRQKMQTFVAFVAFCGICGSIFEEKSFLTHFNFFNRTIPPRERAFAA
jgi:hypothetical protein